MILSEIETDEIMAELKKRGLTVVPANMYVIIKPHKPQTYDKTKSPSSIYRLST